MSDIKVLKNSCENFSYLIPGKDDMGPGTTLGHPVPAPTSLKPIVFSLNLDLVCFEN